MDRWIDKKVNIESREYCRGKGCNPENDTGHLCGKSKQDGFWMIFARQFMPLPTTNEGTTPYARNE